MRKRLPNKATRVKFREGRANRWPEKKEGRKTLERQWIEMWLHLLRGFYIRENVGSKINPIQNYLKMYCLQKTVINLTDSQKGLFKLQGFAALSSYANHLQIGRSTETNSKLIQWHVEPFPSLNCIFFCLSLSFILQHGLTWLWSKGLSWDVNIKIQVFSRPLLACASSEQAVPLPQSQAVSKDQWKTSNTVTYLLLSLGKDSFDCNCVPWTVS